MDSIKDTLAALSEAATQGEWSVDGPAHNRIIWSDPENRVCFMAHSDGKDRERDMATPAFIAALVNAYRTGQLVPVPSVEVVAKAIYEADDPWHIAFPWPNPDGLGAAARYRTIAATIISAMKGEG